MPNWGSRGLLEKPRVVLFVRCGSCRVYTIWSTNGRQTVRMLGFNRRWRFHLGATASPIALLFDDLGLWIEHGMDTKGIAMSPIRRGRWRLGKMA
jgi:hypothetical protein